MVNKQAHSATKQPHTAPLAQKTRKPSHAGKRKALADEHARPRKARRMRVDASDAVSGPTLSADPEAPTLREWREMVVNSTLSIADEDNNLHEFEKGDFVQVLPQGVDPEDLPNLVCSDFWVGCICDIRSRKKRTMEGLPKKEAWVQVQWLYSPADVSTLRAREIRTNPKKPYTNISKFSPYERFWSPHKDVISCECLNDVVRVDDFREADIDRPPIPDETFFIRYHLDTRTGHFTATPQNKSAHDCVCGTPYNTGDPDERMRFCPRPACRRAYHVSCLDPYPAAGFTDTRTLFISSHPHKNRPVDMRGSPRDMRPPSSGGKGKGKGKGKERAVYDVDGPETQEVASLLPEALVALAGQPVVRGGGTGGGVAGNVWTVCRARLKVYEITESGLPDDDWEEEFADAPEPDKLEAMTVYQCPHCVGPI